MNKSEQKFIDLIQLEKEEKEKIHYESFEDTIKYISKEKLKEFLRRVRVIEDRNRNRNYIIFKLLISTGMRVGEFSKIKVNHINFKECSIFIPKENTKTKKPRTVRVQEETMLDLKDYLDNNKIYSGFIFANKNRNKFTERFYQKLLDKYMIKYGLKQELDIDINLSVHKIRHSHIIGALQSKIPINAIMLNVGHQSLKTTQIYAKLCGADIVHQYKDFEF